MFTSDKRACDGHKCLLPSGAWMNWETWLGISQLPPTSSLDMLAMITFLCLHRLLAMHQMRWFVLVRNMGSKLILYSLKYYATSCSYHILSRVAQFWYTSFSLSSRRCHWSFKNCFTFSFVCSDGSRQLFCVEFHLTTKLLEGLLPHFGIFASVVVWERDTHANWPKCCIICMSVL